MEIACPAKINLYLRVTGKRPDGFHGLETLFQEIDLRDRLVWEPGDGPLHLDTPGVTLCPPEQNLVWRAAKCFERATGNRVGGRFTLEKHIPHGGGLGGGSSNGAGALRLLNQAFGNPLETAQMAQLALELGSDVPFFLYGGCRLGRGRGELLYTVAAPAGPRGGFLLLPGIEISTVAVFRAYAAGVRPLPPGEGVPAVTGENDLLPAALSVSDAFAAAWRGLQQVLGPRVFMTGSGSTCVCLTDSPQTFPLNEIAALGVRAVPFRFVSLCQGSVN